MASLVWRLRSEEFSVMNICLSLRSVANPFMASENHRDSCNAVAIVVVDSAMVIMEGIALQQILLSALI